MEDSIDNDALIIEKLNKLVQLKQEDFQKIDIDFEEIFCGTEATLTPMGCAQVNSLNIRQLTGAEWDALFNDWNQRAALMMKTYCDRVAPENCRTVLPIWVSHPPRFSGRTGRQGQPPHLMCVKMDIKFQCVETV